MNKFIKIFVASIIIGGIAFSVAGQVEKPKTFEYQVAGEKVIVGNQPKMKEGFFGATIENFNPEVKLEKWGNETSLRVWTEEIGDKDANQTGKKVNWKAGKKEFNFYPLTSEQTEGGGFEYEIILNERPTEDFIDLKIDLTGLVCYFQPPLTQAEIDEGAIRPDNVINSYACYHESKSGHVIGQTNYMAGKAFHIYRPELTDANGEKVWADFTDDLTETGRLRIAIPAKFLDNAVYPVVVDPTFGNTGVGGTEFVITTGDQSNSTHSVVGVNGTINSISYYGRKVTTSLGTLGVLYLVSDRSVVQSGTEVIVNSTIAQWWTSSGFNASISDTNYYVGFINDFGDVGDNVSYYYDTVASANRISEFIVAYPTPDNPGTVIASTRKISIYATYTPAAPEATSNSSRINGSTRIMGGTRIK